MPSGKFWCKFANGMQVWNVMQVSKYDASMQMWKVQVWMGKSAICKFVIYYSGIVRFKITYSKCSLKYASTCKNMQVYASICKYK